MTPPRQVAEPRKAAEILAAECGHPLWCVRILPEDGGSDGDHLVAALLAAVPPDQDVVIRRESGEVVGVAAATFYVATDGGGIREISGYRLSPPGDGTQQ